MYYIKAKKRVNSQKYEKIVKQFDDDDIQKVVDYVKENNLTATSPYFFTHLKLSDDTIITQEIQGLTCSPIKLRDLLDNK